MITTTVTTFWSAEQAQNRTAEVNQYAMEKRELRASVYTSEVIYNEIKYVSEHGVNKHIHILPFVNVDKKLVIKYLIADDYKVRHFGRLLIIYW